MSTLNSWKNRRIRTEPELTREDVADRWKAAEQAMGAAMDAFDHVMTTEGDEGLWQHDPARAKRLDAISTRIYALYREVEALAESTDMSYIEITRTICDRCGGIISEGGAPPAKDRAPDLRVELSGRDPIVYEELCDGCKAIVGKAIDQRVVRGGARKPAEPPEPQDNGHGWPVCSIDGCENNAEKGQDVCFRHRLEGAG